MNLPTIFRAGGMVAIAVLLQSPCLAEDNAASAAYVEGTVAAIPGNTPGTLELARSTGLRFQYGDSVYQIPADRVTGFHLGRKHHGVKSQVTAGVVKMGHTMLPMLFRNSKRYLRVDFQPKGSTSTQHVVFQVSKEVASAARPALEAWTAKNLAVSTAGPVLSAEDTWWGNRYWKTKRNRHLWEAARKKSRAGTKVEVAARK